MCVCVQLQQNAGADAGVGAERVQLHHRAGKQLPDSSVIKLAVLKLVTQKYNKSYTWCTLYSSLYVIKRVGNFSLDTA